MDYTLYLGDCLEEMNKIPGGSIDAIIADPPYGVTQCKWDSLIPLPKMWGDLKRVVKNDAPIVIHASQPFTSALVMSNPDAYHYCWVWEKSQPTGHLNCKKQPMRKHEDILVFSFGKPFYCPQITDRPRKNIRPDTGGNGTTVYSAFKKTKGFREIPINKTYPQTILRFNSVNALHRIHDTQKPVDLVEYLVRTYTKPGDVVLDFSMGSGTTGVACGRTGRKFIGIELMPEYFEIAENRIMNAYGDYVPTLKEAASGQLSMFDNGKSLLAAL